MNVLPTQEEVRRIASTGKYKVIPVSCEILSDFTTPIETLRRLKNVSMRCYMLESAYANETRGRYTFLGFDPIMEIRCADGEMTAGILKLQTEHPSAYLRQILSEYKSLPEVLRDIFPTIILDIAKRRQKGKWKIQKNFRM